MAVLMAIGIFAVPAAPAFAINTTQNEICYVTASGSQSTYSLDATYCAGGAWLAAGYLNLQLVIYGRCDSVVYDSEVVSLTFNGDSGAHYDNANLKNGGYYYSNNQASLPVGEIPCQTAGGPAHLAGAITVDIPVAASNAFNKVTSSTNTINRSSNQSLWGSDLQFFSGAWHPSTAAGIYRIDIALDHAANWLQWGHFELFEY